MKYCSSEQYFLGSRVNDHLCEEESSCHFGRSKRAPKMHTKVEEERAGAFMYLIVINGENSDDSSEHE